MTMFLAILQLIIMACVTLYEYYKKSISFFLWAMASVIFSVMHFLTVLNGAEEYPLWVYNNASLFVIGFSIFYLITRTLILRNGYAIYINTSVSTIKKESWNDPINKRFIKLMVAILVVTMGYSTYMIAKVSGGILNSSWGAAYNYLVAQEYITFDKIARWFFFPCGSIFLIGLIKRNKTILLMTTLPILLFVFASRNKADLLPLLIGTIIYFSFRKEKVSIKSILLLVLMGIAGIYAIYALQTFRHLGTITSVANSMSFIEFNNLVLDKLLSGEGELSLVKVFYHFIYYDNNFPDFNKGNTYIRMLLVLLPTRFSFGLKPADFGISMGSAWIMDFNNTAFSTHPTFFGDLFANMGYYGIFMGVFWAFFIYGLDKLADRKNQIVKLVIVNLIAGNYILIGRGSVYNSYTSIVYGLIIIGVIYFISRIKLMKRY